MTRVTHTSTWSDVTINATITLAHKTTPVTTQAPTEPATMVVEEDHSLNLIAAIKEEDNSKAQMTSQENKQRP